MAHKNVLASVFICLSFFFNHPARARFVPNSTLTDDDDQPNYIKHFAVWHTVNEEWHGGKASIDLWGIPYVKLHAYSTAGITLSNDNGFYNAIRAGFHVRPDFYNNLDLRFYVYWTVDGTTDCYYNTCDPGFVIADSSPLQPGQAVKPLSTYGGNSYYITIRIIKDDQSGNWQVYRDDPCPVLLGWWPKTLFTSLSNNATYVEWGGSVGFLKNETCPPMGSGHFSDEGARKAAYMTDISLFDTNGGERYTLDGSVAAHQDREDCYTVSEMKITGNGKYMFYYGGPPECQN